MQAVLQGGFCQSPRRAHFSQSSVPLPRLAGSNAVLSEKPDAHHNSNCGKEQPTQPVSCPFPPCRTVAAPSLEPVLPDHRRKMDKRSHAEEPPSERSQLLREDDASSETRDAGAHGRQEVGGTLRPMIFVRISHGLVHLPLLRDRQASGRGGSRPVTGLKFRWVSSTAPLGNTLLNATCADSCVYAGTMR